MKPQQLFIDKLAPVNGMLHFIAGDHENGITQIFQFDIKSFETLYEEEDLLTAIVDVCNTNFNITPLYAILIAPHFDENLLAYCEQLRNNKYSQKYALYYNEVGC